VTLSELLCRVFGHKRDAQRVWHDELDFRSHCIRCDAPMVRERAGKWRPFDPVKTTTRCVTPNARGVARTPAPDRYGVPGGRHRSANSSTGAAPFLFDHEAPSAA